MAARGDDDAAPAKPPRKKEKGKGKGAEASDASQAARIVEISRVV